MDSHRFARLLALSALAWLAACGTSSSPPLPVPPEPPPLDAPVFLAATPGEDSVALAWTAVEGALVYNLYFDAESGVTPETGEAVPGIDATSYVHAGLEPGTTWYYVVAAEDARGEGPASDEIAATVPLPPPDIHVGPELLEAAIEGRPWVGHLEASGGRAPYVFAVPDRPAWMLLDPATGLLWGRAPPAAPDVIALHATATDADGVEGEAEVLLPMHHPAPSLPPLVLAAAGPAESDRFATVEACAPCHQNAAAADAMRDASGRPIAPVDLWLPSLMSDSMRDPYHRAVLRSELDALPDIAGIIEDTCLTCHAPMPAYELHQEGETIPLDVVYGDSAVSLLALEGNSCTMCHQVVDDGLGERSSGDLLFGDDHVIWAPHEDPFAMPMIGFSGYAPEEGDHVAESAMCAVCHTLRVPSFALDGTPLGTFFPEQMPYLEWQNSVFSTEADEPAPEAASCVDCHMPKVDEDGLPIATRIARRPGGTDYPSIDDRQPYGRHLLLGGNVAMLAMLRDQAQDLNPRADTDAFDAAIARTRAQLQQFTATLAVEGIERTAAALAFDIRVENLLGHKFPTSFPMRRAWLRIELEDEDEQLVFASGRVDETGTLVDMEGYVLPLEAVHGPIEPHHDVLENPRQVQIWEAIAHDVTGHPTYHLLYAQDWLKDNRLLPRGWSDAHPEYEDIQPHGVGDDPDFVGGSDVVHVRLANPPAGALHLHVALLYQSISARAVYELIAHDELPEVNAFRQYWEASDREPELVQELKLTIP